jgi:hypothetical protein
MADSNFDILIRFGLSKEKATEAVNELKKIEEQTTKTGVEGVKQEEAVTEATKKGIGFKQQAREALKGLASQFPVLGQIGQLALSPITLAFAGLTAAVTIYQRKMAEAVRAQGGFEMPDISEDIVARFERMGTAAKEINTNLKGIGGVLDKFKAEQDVLDAMATGFGSDPNSTGARAQAAREAGDRATAEAARLRGIAGNIDPKNAAAGDMSAMLPSLQGHRTEMLDKLGLINSVRDGTAGMKGSARYLSLFGLSDPESMAAKYQGEISQTDAQIGGIMAGGKRRGERLGAFEGAAAAESQAAGFYREAAGLGATQASGAGKDLKSASDALARGDLTQMVNNIIRIAEAATRGKEITDQALRDLNNVP